MIERAGIYKTSVQEYHTDSLMEVPTLNASAIKDLVNKSRLHCWQNHPRFGGNDVEREHKRHMDKGSALHAMVLGSGDKIRKIDADNYRKKEAQDQKNEAIEAWEIPLLYADHDELEQAAISIRDKISRHTDASTAFTAGKPEMTGIWEEDGVWCRIRLDWLPLDGRQFYDDFKGTEGSAEPGDWSRYQIFRMGYDIQAAFYVRGIRALGLHRDPIFRFIVGEMNKPYAISAIACMPSLIEHGMQKVEQAIGDWRDCLNTGRWHGYANGNWWADVPSYLLADAEMRRLRSEDNEGETE